MPSSFLLPIAARILNSPLPGRRLEAESADVWFDQLDIAARRSGTDLFEQAPATTPCMVLILFPTDLCHKQPIIKLCGGMPRMKKIRGVSRFLEHRIG